MQIYQVQRSSILRSCPWTLAVSKEAKEERKIERSKRLRKKRKDLRVVENERKERKREGNAFQYRCKKCWHSLKAIELCCATSSDSFSRKWKRE